MGYSSRSLGDQNADNKDCTQKASNENADCTSISYFAIAAINYPDQKQLKRERTYWLMALGTTVHHGRTVMAAAV